MSADAKKMLQDLLIGLMIAIVVGLIVFITLVLDPEVVGLHNIWR